jgi:outer membrane lipoprotein SlyB
MPMKDAARALLTAALLLPIVAACASKRPVLYPNAQLKAVGSTTAQRDIDACIDLAEDHGVDAGQTEGVAGSAGAGGAVGGAAGAASGAVLGRPGIGAAAGAAGGAAGGLVRGALKARDPDPVFKRFVERCLRDKGYDVVGWR